MSNKNSRLLNPASHPACHAWVSANAGAGKTSLLVERVLRLLLGGAQPSSILCLTYTRAAAAEMAERIRHRLGEWAVMEEGALTDSLQALEGIPPTRTVLDRARLLLALVLDEPEGLRIQTIHSFCQSILHRFPLEAGMPPYFTVMDERTSEELMREAGLRLLHLERQERPQLRQAVEFLAGRYSDYGFQSILQLLHEQSRKLRSVISEYAGLEECKDALARVFGIGAARDEASLLAQHFDYAPSVRDGLRAATAALYAGEEEGHFLAEKLECWLADPDSRLQQWPDYAPFFLTKEHKPRQKVLPEKLMPDGGIAEILKEEQARVLACKQAMLAVQSYEASAHLLEVSAALLALYQELKDQHALLDYEDLILRACRLLLRPGIAPWVLFKLDGGIDHLLVDEAQDTSREQWEIVRALTEEFFAGEGRTAHTRTLFVVGDEKQSIFSFQGAQPKEFLRMRDYFEQRAKEAGLAWVTQSLERSRRSTDPVLQAVDRIFASPDLQAAVLAEGSAIRHIPHRSREAGRVELWPLVQLPDATAEVKWELPLAPRYRLTAPQQLADSIAQTIKAWLDRGEMLESAGRPIRPGDIMILLQRRHPLAGPMMRALKRLNIPVTGSSRAPLAENLAVMDLLALGKFLLLPEDDLNLAALLKSPLLGLSEEELLTLAQERQERSLWSRLQEARGETFQRARDLLLHLLDRADFMPSFELFSEVLDVQGGRDRLLGRMGTEYREAVREFLEQALAYENTHTPTLQGFVQWLEHSSAPMKENEQSQGAVRLLTAHGAKGLEAPIVFLADANAKQAGRHNVPSILWHESLALWPRSPAKGDPLSRTLYQRLKDDEYAEYLRLYYVALTRARDRLYVCGWENGRQSSQPSWYDIAADALKPLMQPCDTPLGQGWRMESPQLETIAPAPTVMEKNLSTIPAWVTAHAPPEPEPATPLTPSRASLPEPAAHSPLSQTSLYRRGKLIHRLLQYLPELPVEHRWQAAARFLERHAAELPKPEQETLLRETLTIIESPDYAPFFAPGSLAEVPVSGSIVLDGKPYIVSGQIDRLCVGEREVWAIDYKSGRLPPERMEDTPAAYLRQMAAYRALLQAIYPRQVIRCALLWTAVPRLVTLPEVLLAVGSQALDAA